MGERVQEWRGEGDDDVFDDRDGVSHGDLGRDRTCTEAHDITHTTCNTVWVGLSKRHMQAHILNYTIILRF